MAKRIETGSQARKSIMQGLNTIADVVKTTIGAKGRNVMIYNGGNSSPHIINDGVSIAREVILEDLLENAGAQLIRDVSANTDDSAGDGTTTTAVLTQAIANNGMEALEAGHNPIILRKGMEKALEVVLEELKNTSKKVEDINTVKHVANISSGNDVEVSQYIGEAMEKVGFEGVITVDKSDNHKTSLRFVEGMQLDTGYISRNFVNRKDKEEVEYENPLVLIYHKNVDNIMDIYTVLEYCATENKPLVFIASDVDGDALRNLIQNHMAGIVKVVAVKAPSYGITQKEMLEDIAKMTGATVYSDVLGIKPQEVDHKFLGVAKRVSVTKNSCTIIAPDEGSHITKDVNNETGYRVIDKLDLEERIEEIEMLLKNNSGTSEEDTLKLRLARLSGAVAVISIGAQTEVAMRERRLRVEDALNATKAAVDEGIIAGGGVALRNIYSKFRDAEYQNKLKESWSEEFITGFNAVVDALPQPFIQILVNAGTLPDEAISMSKAKLKPNVGIDVISGEEVDMIETGIIDPVKVTRTAMQNATSIASTLITTEVGIVPKVEKE